MTTLFKISKINLKRKFGELQFFFFEDFIFFFFVRMIQKEILYYKRDLNQ